MTYIEQADLFQNFTEQQFKILRSKGDDYAGEDRLHSFKSAGAIAGISPEINCLSLIATKVSRLGTLLKHSSEVNNESMADTIVDLGNYVFLLHCILKESKTMKDGQ